MTRLESSPTPLWDTHDALLFDLDGVVYRAHTPVPFAVETITSAAKRRSILIRYVTNNASRTRAEVADKLSGLGLVAGADDVITSGQAVAALIADQQPPGIRVFVVGSDALRGEIREAGLIPVESATDSPDVVVQGLDPGITWRDLADASRAIGNGARWYASNTDATLPVDWGVAPGNGTLVDAVATATGIRPEVAGKPEPVIMRTAIADANVTAPLVVGDRLDTDIAGARNAGFASLWVATGIDSLHQVSMATGEQRPSYLGSDLRSLERPQAAVAPVAGTLDEAVAVRCGEWVADPIAGTLTRASRPDGQSDSEPESPIRAIVAACWALADSGADRSVTADAADRLIRIWHDEIRKG